MEFIKKLKLLIMLGLLPITILFSISASIPLTGSHGWRQADTLFTAYFYCHEDNTLLNPRVGPRNNTNGIAIGEFPLFSWLVAQPCVWLKQSPHQWSELWPKIFSFVLFFLSALFFSFAFFKSDRERLIFKCLFLFSTLHLSFLTLPLPDSLAVFCFALASFFYQKSHKKNHGLFALTSLVALALTILGFAIRPYLATLGLLNPAGLLSYLAYAYGTLKTYDGWYLTETLRSELPYYLNYRKPLAEALTELPVGIWQFFGQVLKDHTNYIALPGLLLGLLTHWRLALLWTGSFLLVAMTSGHHFGAHPYYLLSVSIIGLIILTKMFSYSKNSRAFLVLAIYIIIGVANSQHHFHVSKSNDWKTIPELVKDIPYSEKIVSLNPIANTVPNWLYFAKRNGFSLINTPENQAQACQLGPRWVLITDQNKTILKDCQNED